MQKDSQILQKQSGFDMWTSLVEDFRVKTSALPENVKVLKGNDPAYGVRCIELYGRLDLNTSSLRTPQLLLFPASNRCYATFPKSGMMRNGNVYQTTLLDTRTKGKDFILLPNDIYIQMEQTFITGYALCSEGKYEEADPYLETAYKLACQLPYEEGFKFRICTVWNFLSTLNFIDK